MMFGQSIENGGTCAPVSGVRYEGHAFEWRFDGPGAGKVAGG